ncbi:hypothetical protein VBZ51_14165 [Maribacter sp. HS]|uniref:hypothetical protein n=1 Tax=Maribacter sp. HS TaxID=3110480 RepID=UPI003A8C5332
MNDFEKLKKNLRVLFETENKIAALIQSNGLRFSTNKITADIGEFYAHKLLNEEENMFEVVTQEKSSNSECDLIGILKKDSSLKKHFSSKEIKIEVKTRRNQKGVKYLSSLKPEKFDLLCMIDINQDYTLNQIYLITAATTKEFLDIKYSRLIFKEEMAFITLVKP